MSTSSTRLALPAAAARKNAETAIAGTFLRLESLPADVDVVTVRVDDAAAAAIDLVEGDAIVAECGFDRLFLEHAASAIAGARVEFLVGRGLAVQSGRATEYVTSDDGVLEVLLADRLDSELDSIRVDAGGVPLEVDANESEWTELGATAAALASASHAADANGGAHAVTALEVGYDDPAAVGTFRILDGGVVIWEGVVHGRARIEFARPLAITPGAAVDVELDADAAATGYVALAGYTRDA